MIYYWHDIMRGEGWEDICVKHKITDIEKQHYVRECVLYYAKQKPRRFSIHYWRQVSGMQISPDWSRPDRPTKRPRSDRPDARQGNARLQFRNHVPLFQQR